MLRFALHLYQVTSIWSFAYMKCNIVCGIQYAWFDDLVALWVRIVSIALTQLIDLMIFALQMNEWDFAYTMPKVFTIRIVMMRIYLVKSMLVQRNVGGPLLRLLWNFLMTVGDFSFLLWTCLGNASFDGWQNFKFGLFSVNQWTAFDVRWHWWEI